MVVYFLVRVLRVCSIIYFFYDGVAYALRLEDTRILFPFSFLR